MIPALGRLSQGDPQHSLSASLAYQVKLQASERPCLKSRQCLRNVFQPLHGQADVPHTYGHTHSKEGNILWVKDALSRRAKPAVHTGQMSTAIVIARLLKRCVPHSHFTQEQLTPRICSFCHLFRHMIDFLSIRERPVSPPVTMCGMPQALRWEGLKSQGILCCSRALAG